MDSIFKCLFVLAFFGFLAFKFNQFILSQPIFLPPKWISLMPSQTHYFIHERRRSHQILLQDPLFRTELSRGPNCFWFNHHLCQVWDFSQKILQPLILHQSSFIRLLTRNPFCLPQIHPLSSQWHPMSPFSNSSVILFGGLWSFQFHQHMPPSSLNPGSSKHHPHHDSVQPFHPPKFDPHPIPPESSYSK